MRIFDSIRGHFALLAKRQLETLPEGAPFTIISVVSTVPREEDWKVVIKPASGKSNSIYVTDILRVYTWLVSSKGGQWATSSEIQDVVNQQCINKKSSSYIMSLLSTFDDVESKKGRDAAIRFVLHREKFGKPIQ